MRLQIYVGEECDVTGRGGSIMGFCKSWRSLPIRSWSGGAKLADMPGARANRTVRAPLSALLAQEVLDSSFHTSGNLCTELAGTMHAHMQS